MHYGDVIGFERMIITSVESYIYVRVVRARSTDATAICGPSMITGWMVFSEVTMSI